MTCKHYSPLIIRRITPFIALCCSILASTATAGNNTIEGQWMFVEDGTVIELSPCAAKPDRLCAAIVQVPPQGEKTPHTSLLCRLPLLGDLQLDKPSAQGVSAYRGWIIDPEEYGAVGRTPERYDAILTLKSATQAQIEVRAAAGLYTEHYELARVTTPVKPCR